MGCLCRLVTVHRNRLLGECLKSVLADRIEVILTVYESAAALSAVEQARPDTVLLDACFPDGQCITLIQEIRRRRPEVRILVVGSSDAEAALLDCIRAGVDGCVLEESPLPELKAALEAISLGRRYCDPALLDALFGQLAVQTPLGDAEDSQNAARLTRRELEVLQLISQGHSNKQLARRLRLSLYTVKNHVHNILEKLHVEDRYEAVAYARRQRWISAAAPQVTQRCQSHAIEAYA